MAAKPTLVAKPPELAKPQVVLLATGGTIASRYDPARGRTVAPQRAEDLLALLSGRI